MNTIKVKRGIDGRRYEASGRYADEDDGWYVTVGVRSEGKLAIFERRGPVNDAWEEIVDMLDLAVSGAYARLAGAL